MRILIQTFLICAVMTVQAPANPATFGDGGVSLQKVLDDITLPNPGGPSSVNVLTDALSDTKDSYWNITAAGASVNTIVIELAAYEPNNIFGVYDSANSENKVQVFAGAAGTGTQAYLAITDNGSVLLNLVDTGIDFGGNSFGYYLDSPGGLWYSDTSLNNDSMDHMYAYQGKNVDTVKLPGWPAGLWTDNEYVLAFEDLYQSPQSFGDYDDFVVMVESVMPIPAPGAILLGGIGIGLVGWLKRRRTL